MTEQKKDYSKLRPFDLEAAKAGEPICWKDGDQLSYVAGPDCRGQVCYEHQQQMFFAFESVFRMAPLAWVEGKPVYKGDTLYSEFFALGDRANGAANCGGKFVVSGIKQSGYLLASDRGVQANTDVASCSWNPPKVKREGWIVVSSDDAIDCALTKAIWPTEVEAKAAARKAVLLTNPRAVRIEWEQ